MHIHGQVQAGGTIEAYGSLNSTNLNASTAPVWYYYVRRRRGPPADFSFTCIVLRLDFSSKYSAINACLWHKDDGSATKLNHEKLFIQVAPQYWICL